jgi:pimeloyl-ACP methyl ester carboxylesterase
MIHSPVALLITVSLLAGCTGPASSPGSSDTGTPFATASRTVDVAPTPTGADRLLAGKPMGACRLNGMAALCGTLDVPEDRADPSGRWISLRVAVIPTQSRQPQPDPVFLLAGGPGGAATQSFAWAAGTFSAVNRDFVLVDQRGTGGSNRLVVPTPPDLSGLVGAERDAAAEAWVDETLATMPGDPRFYTTSVAMDDLEAVRVALGYDRINLYGASYGATAAQYYVRQYEASVRSVVLDGGTLLDVPVFERIALNTQRALDLLFDRCAADATCSAAYPELQAEFRAIVARLANETVTTSVTDPWSGEPIVIDPVSFASAVHAGLLDANVSSRMPALLHAGFLGAWDTVAQASADAGRQAAPDRDVLAMASVIRCSEAWARYDPAEVERLGAGTFELEAQLANARMQAESCRFIPAGAVPENDADPVRSDVPVLLVLGEADPQDPPSNVTDAPAELPNSLTVVVPGQGHTVGHLGCMPSVVVAFINAGTVDDLDVSCAATGVPLPPFLTLPD